MPSPLVIPSTGCSPYAFGDALAAHGDALLVGAPFRDYGLRADEGIPPPAAGVYVRAHGRWTLQQVLVAADPRPAEGFGRSVALGPSHAVVAAPGHENGDGPLHDFRRDGAGPFRLAATYDSPERLASHVDVFAEYGVALASDERRIVVGAPLAYEARAGEPTVEGGGMVYVFDRGAPSAAPVATLRGTRPDEGLGTAVALSGDLLVVGAATNESLPGAAYVYRREASGRWRELCRVEGRAPGEHCGAAVAIDGTRFAVAAPGRADLGGAGGRCDLFDLAGGGCRQTASIQEAPGFALSVALRGDRLVIGQPMFGEHGGPRQTGRVGLFRVSGAGVVTKERWLVAAQPPEYARVGSAVAIGPDYLAAGAPGLGQGDAAGFVVVEEWTTA